MTQALGRQIICDCFGCNKKIASIETIKKVLHDAAKQANVTILELIVHQFHPHGISAIALLAESHIFVHTWPEKNYMAIDVFTCGFKAQPEKVIDVFRQCYKPASSNIREELRGNFNIQQTRLTFEEQQTHSVRLVLDAKRKLLSHQTPYQHLEVFETIEHGKLLALDGKVMLTERDEAFYHEMLVHPPLFIHPCPKQVLIIGGGDGGAIREVLKHPGIEHVFWIEIDEEVIKTAQAHLPNLIGRSLQDPRVHLNHCDGNDYLSNRHDSFDVILVDSTDPVGPATSLFTNQFMNSCRQALTKDGIFTMQSGTPFYSGKSVRETVRNLKSIFNHVRLHLGFVPTYPSGLWSFATSSNSTLQVTQSQLASRWENRNIDCQYYNPEVHVGSAQLPDFVLALE